MNYYWLLFLLIILLIINIIIKILKQKQNLNRTLDMSFLRITMPKKDSDLDEKHETTKDFKEMISLMEQLLSSLKSIYSSKLKKKILGQDYLSLEYIAHENDIYFYVVTPKEYKDLIEKQINWFYPDAIIEETPEINIFKWKKYYDWTYINPVKQYFFPIKTYQKLESDPINNITNAFSKLEDDESAAVQIMLKPVDDDWQYECAKASTAIMQWKKNKFHIKSI